MHYKEKAILIVLLLFITVGITYAGVDMNDGMWEISAKVEMPGMPMEMPAVTFKQCLTSVNNIPNNREQNPHCKIINNKVTGNTITWEMQCVNEGRTMNISGRISYNGDTFKGEVKSEMDGMEMVQRMNGRRIGDCK